MAVKVKFLPKQHIEWNAEKLLAERVELLRRLLGTADVLLENFTPRVMEQFGLGWDAVHDRVHVHDLHATILHLLGLDHERLTYRHAGRDYRLTDVSGVVVRPILA